MGKDSGREVLIIGGGLMGLSLAHELARKKISVEILSRRRNEAAGFVAAGMLAPHAEGLENKLLRMGQISLEEIPNWISKIEADSGMSCGLINSGIIVPFKNTEKRNQYPTAKWGKPLNRNQLEKEIPGIHENWETGLLFENDGQIDNRRKLMRALENACVHLGVNFLEGVEVMKINQKGSSFNGLLIKTATGEIKNIVSEIAILCCGAWSSDLLKELSVFPVKGQMCSIQGPKNAFKRILFGPGTYLVPRNDGLIIVGATNEPNSGFKNGLTPNGQKELEIGISSLLPEAFNWPTMERWWGFRPCTHDLSPILGESSIKGLWLATGHHRNGVLLAAITTKWLTSSICNEPLSKKDKALMTTFRWNR